MRSLPNAEVLGAYLNAILAGANEYDADDIAKVIERRPRASYKSGWWCSHRPGRPEPSREPLVRI
jgi:hypothetical protein